MSDEKEKDVPQKKVSKSFFKKNKKELSIFEEEQVQNPAKTMMKNFFGRRITKVALTIYSIIFLASMIIPFFLPVDYSAADSTQMHLPPGFTFMKVPEGLKGKAAMIDAGGNFAAGIDKDGNLRMWGNLSDKLKQLPAGMGKIKDVSTGYDHAIALNEEGKVFTWGSNKFGLETPPIDMTYGANIVQVVAGYQISFALDDKGKVYIWGNENLISVNPKPVQGMVKQIEANISTAIVLLEDGSVSCLSRKESPFLNIPDRIQGHVIDIAITDRAGGAVLEDGTVAVWGLSDYDIYNIPERVQGHAVEIVAGSGHFTVRLDDGSVESWGLNANGQGNAPSLSDIVYLDADYKGNYAIDSSGNVHAWGLKGYLMGTDHMGRDIFPRLMAGGRISLTVGIISVIISACIGITLGGIAGYNSGKVDIAIMRVTEIFQSIPFLPIAIILSYIVGNNISQYQRVFMIMAIQGMLNWPAIARLVRSQILAARENEYVTAAKAMGVKERAIVFKHILPNIIGPVMVTLTLRLSSAIIYESTLSFIGFGILEPIPTWGNMLSGSLDSRVIETYWWRWVFTATALSATTLSIYMIGDGLSDAIDPKRSER